MDWHEHQLLEESFWGSCGNTFGEELKQLLYAEKMGFKLFHDGNSPYNFDGQNLSYLDIGGGPSSILLKFKNVKYCTVVDPCNYPKWVGQRYYEYNIEQVKLPGEEINKLCMKYDVVLIYNVLQHTEDPELIINNAKSISGKLKMFEWIDIPPHPGHPIELTEEKLNKWTGQIGKTELLSGQNECYGKCWFI
jgi:hypothetical protein